MAGGGADRGRATLCARFRRGWLDEPPEFSGDMWHDWTSEKHEQFGERWTEVQAVLADLRSHGVFLLDVSPNNIAFRF